MGYGVAAYAVDLALVRQILGSENEEMFEGAARGLERKSADLNDLIRDVVEEDAPTARDLLRGMVFGEPYDERLGFAYGYVLEHLCDVHGVFLDNSAWMPVDMSFIDAIAAELSEAGVAKEDFSIQALVFGGSPVPLPPIDDFPAIGHFERTKVPRALEALSSVDLARLADRNVRAGVAALKGWLSRSSEAGVDLVCFYH